MIISSIPATLAFTRVLIASFSSCKVNSSDRKDLCSSALYLEYGISIFDCFFITCVLPFLISTWAIWFAVGKDSPLEGDQSSVIGVTGGRPGPSSHCSLSNHQFKIKQ